MKRIIKYPCPVCGALTRTQKSYGTFEICPTCGWEDDNAQVENPNLSGGANSLSLNEARKVYQRSANRKGC